MKKRKAETEAKGIDFTVPNWWYSTFRDVTAMVRAGALSLPYAVSKLDWLRIRSSLLAKSEVLKAASLPSSKALRLNFHFRFDLAGSQTASNIDHSQDLVRKDIREWLRWLRKETGYDGWRLDYVGGFWCGYVKEHMEASEPFFINDTNGTAGAFDVTTKGILHSVFEYFASVKNTRGETRMTPGDLMRVIVPVYPPSESNVVRDGSFRGERLCTIRIFHAF
ncbi:alpha-amylase 3, chloroplastic-like protein [Tanacetum coccineum]